MKNLQIKFGLFSLLAVLAVSVFLTSCEQTEIVTEDINPTPATLTEDLQGGTHILPPNGFEDKTDEEKRLFFEELSEEEAQRFTENYRVFDYLVSEGMVEDIGGMLDDGELFSELDFSDILSANQLEEMDKHEISNIESRGCYWVWITCYYAGYWHWGSWYPIKRVYRLFCSHNGYWYGYYYAFTHIPCY